MRSFVLEEFLLVKGPVRFYKLRIDGWSPLDEFWAEIQREGNLAKQLNSAVAIMERVSANQRLPANKYKKVSGPGAAVNEYEIKTKDLRIYLFRLPGGAVLVWGGKKSTQRSDLNRFRNIKEEYLLSTSDVYKRRST